MSYNDGRTAAIRDHGEGWPISQYPSPEPGQRDGFLMSKTSEWLRGYRDYYAPIEQQRNRHNEQYEAQMQRQGHQVNPEDTRKREARKRRLQSNYNPREGNIVPTNCPICMRPITNSNLPVVLSECGHYLHEECKNALFAQARGGDIHCPTCRDPLKDREFMPLRQRNITPGSAFNLEGNPVTSEVISVDNSNSNSNRRENLPPPPPRAQASRAHNVIDLIGDESPPRAQARVQARDSLIYLDDSEASSPRARNVIDLIGDDSPPRARNVINLLDSDNDEEDPNAMDIGGKSKSRRSKKSRKSRKSRRSKKGRKSRRK